MSIAVAYVLKFTINRVSMFALVFAIGILVDDAIVVVENIYRRWLEAGTTPPTDHGRGGGRGRQSDHPRDLHRGGGAAADGLRQRHDGPLHAAHPGPVLGGDDLLAVCRLRLRALAGGAGEAEHVDAEERRRRASTARPRRSAAGTARSSRRSWTTGWWATLPCSPSSPPCSARSRCSCSRRWRSRCCPMTTSRRCRSSSTCPRARTCS